MPFHSLAKNSSAARLNSVGFSRVSQWPHWGKMHNSESLINVCALWAHETGTYLSSAPWRINVGTASVGSFSTKLVWRPLHPISLLCQDLHASPTPRFF